MASPFPPGPVSAQALLSGVGRRKAGRRLGSTDPGVCCIVVSGRWGDSWRQPRGGFFCLCHLNRRGFHRPLSTKGAAQPRGRLPPAPSWRGLSTTCLCCPHFLSLGRASWALLGHSQDRAFFCKQGRAPYPLGCPTSDNMITGSAFPSCAYPVPNILSCWGSSGALLALKPPKCLSGGLSLLASLISRLP